MSLKNNFTIASIKEVAAKIIPKYTISAIIVFLTVLFIACSLLYAKSIIPASFALTALLSLIAAIVYYIFIVKKDKIVFYQNLDACNGSGVSPKFKIIESIYLVLMSILMMTLFINPKLTVGFHAIAVTAIAVLVGLILVSNTKFEIGFSLLSVMYMAFTVSLSFFRHVFWAGGDMGYHARIGNYIAVSGYYVSDFFSKEFPNPLYHITNAMTDVLTALNIRDSTIIGVYIPLIILSIFVYLIVRDIVGKKPALMSLLFYNILPIVLQWRTVDYSTSYGILSALVFIFVAYLYAFKDNGTKMTALLFFTMVVAIFSHLFTSYLIVVAVAIFLFLIYILIQNNILTAIKVPILMLVSLFGYGIISGSLGSPLSSFIYSIQGTSSIVNNGYITSTMNANNSLLSSLAYILNHIPFTIFIGTVILVIAIIILAKTFNLKSFCNVKFIALLFLSVVFLVFMVTSGVILTSMTDRFGVYLSFSSAILFGICISSSTKHMTLSKRKIITIITIFVIVASLSITNPVINGDVQYYNQNDNYNHMKMTYPEFESLNTIFEKAPMDRTIYTTAQRHRPSNLVWDMIHLKTGSTILPYIYIWGGNINKLDLKTKDIELNADTKTHVIVYKDTLMGYDIYGKEPYASRIPEISERYSVLYDNPYMRMIDLYQHTT